MNKQLTLEQIEALRPYEKYFGSVIRAGYSSYPGEPALDKMRNIWADLTGSPYPFCSGCPDSIMNLLRDVGTLYFSATGIDPWNLVEKKIYSHGRLVETIAPSRAAAVETKAAATSKTTTKKKTSATAKKTTAKKK